MKSEKAKNSLFFILMVIGSGFIAIFYYSRYDLPVLGFMSIHSSEQSQQIFLSSYNWLGLRKDVSSFEFSNMKELHHLIDPIYNVLKAQIVWFVGVFITILTVIVKPTRLYNYYRNIGITMIIIGVIAQIVLVQFIYN
ncbi:hypothetical protein [Priestia koreensis]|uniref:Uncharacterized protein n=1 Tax=Priestia koreensis TaxID=284581 RepID=A0A0M0KSS5_9BACI|nr:hypothetical protein [Priestia koreensis]KOO41871.1 hypothetical protein AMD01_18950 [Priestia koreensis]